MTGSSTAGWPQTAKRCSTIWRSWVSIQGRHIGTCTLLGVIIKIVLTVTELLMLWSNTAGLMERRHGMQPTSTENKKDRYKCSLCLETFDQVAQLLSHTQVHEENKYKCDECDWCFYLIAGLTCHGQDCHDTRHHACTWCVEYFSNVDKLHTHIRCKHHFECTICHDVSPTAEELEEHIKEKHGGLQPGEQELQTQRCREEGSWNKVSAGRRRLKKRQSKRSTSHARSV